MRIGINTLGVYPARSGGRTFLQNVVSSMAEVAPEHEYVLVARPANEGLFDADETEAIERVEVPLTSNSAARRHVFEQLRLPGHLSDMGLDVLLSPGNTATLRTDVPQVLVVQGPLTVRDLRREHAPGFWPLRHRLFYDLMHPLSVRRADAVVAVSDAIAEHILAQNPDCEDKLEVVHEGVDREAYETRPDVDLPVAEPFILFLSTLFEYKNADKLLQAFADLKERTDLPHHLAIVGKDVDGERDRLASLAGELGVDNKIHLPGMVPGYHVKAYYHDADVFVFPSAVESFGLPPLEAMAAGTPVIGSNRLSVPEIIGDAGLTVDPDDVDALSRALSRILGDPELRKDLVKRGKERAREMSWDRTARGIEDILRRTGNGL